MIPLTEVKHGLSHRRLKTLCRAGRIYGAVLVGGFPPRWYVPSEELKIMPNNRRPRRY